MGSFLSRSYPTVLCWGFTDYTSIEFRMPSLETTRYVADRTGYLAVANMPLFFLFAGKTKLLSTLTGWSGHTFSVFHKWIARTCIILSLIHSVSYGIIKHQAQRQNLDVSFNPTFWRNGILVCHLDYS